MIIIETSLQYLDYGFVEGVTLLREGLQFIPDAETIEILFYGELLDARL